MFWKDHLRSNYVPLKKYPEKENHESQFKCTDINICICSIIHLLLITSFQTHPILQTKFNYSHFTGEEAKKVK